MLAYLIRLAHSPRIGGKAERPFVAPRVLAGSLKAPTAYRD